MPTRDHLLGIPVTDKHTAMFSTPTMTVAAVGMQGWRKKMEDAHDIQFHVGGDTRSAFVAVFDGHNGCEAARFCSTELLKHVCSRPEFARQDVAKALEHGFVDVDHAFKSKVEEEECGGCAATAVMIRDGQVHCANAGDCRAVIALNGAEGGASLGEVTALSYDHRPSAPEECERIRKAGGELQNGRVNGVLALTRAVGDFEFKKGDREIITARPDVKSVPLPPNVAFVIVACDGVWDTISNEDACALVHRKLRDTEGDAGVAIEALLDACTAKTSDAPVGTDNMTAALWIPQPAFFGTEP